VVRSKRVADVAIVGAGAAGLAAAQRLTHAGRSVVVIDARDRVGGRIHTIRDETFPLPVELGAEFIHGRNVETWDILGAMNASAYFADGHHRHFRGGRLRKIDDFWEQVDKVFARLKRVNRDGDLSFTQFLRRHCNEPRLREARKLALAFVEGFDAADANLISARSLAKAEETSDEVEGESSFRIIDGYSCVTDYLLHSSRRPNLTLRLNTRVDAIRWSRASVEIVARNASAIRARRAIVTVPVGVLREGSLRFDPDLPEKRDAANKIEMGNVVKVILNFAEAFWEQKKLPAAGEATPDVVFMTSDAAAGAAIPTWWTYYPVRSSVLTGWAGGPAAQRLANRTPRAIVDDAIASLAKITGVGRARLAKMLVASHVADWQADELARGAYSYVTVGNLGAPKKLAKPVENILFFAGEATASDGVGGTVDSALASGRRAADEILAAHRHDS
jgi:monoamine oxidase